MDAILNINKLNILKKTLKLENRQVCSEIGANIIKIFTNILDVGLNCGIKILKKTACLFPFYHILDRILTERLEVLYLKVKSFSFRKVESSDRDEK